jgi:rhamnosyltransferase
MSGAAGIHGEPARALALSTVRASVIVRAFNEAKHIGRCFESIYGQRTSFPFEVILVDSGSDDGTLDIAERFGVTIVHIAPDEFSFGRSLNHGIERATGDVCAMISAHCYAVDEQWLEKLVAPFADDHVALTYGKQRGNHLTKYSEQRIFARWFPDASIHRQTHSFCNNANAAIRRSLWMQHRFDESLTGMEDIDWAQHALARGFHLSYVADAGVVHVHEETHRQIYRRYEREALAIKTIYPDAHFSLWDFVHLVTLNTFGDYRAALRDGVLLRNLRAIPIFRALQFLGTYQAHRLKRPFDRRLRFQLYYPPGFGDEGEHQDRTHGPPPPAPHQLWFDISRPLHAELAVWPGSKRFAMEWTKRFDRDGVNESHLSLNTHTGTHIDAPFHFVEGGKKLDEVNLEKLIGESHVVEHLESTPVDAADLERASIPRNCRRLLLKTLNSSKKSNGYFDSSFIALTPAAAQWVVDRQIELIGIDGFSIQLFAEKTNETHRILLSADVVILEGLDLSAVPPGAYHLVALPLNIPGAEGAPARAILTRAPLGAAAHTSFRRS